MNGTERSTVSQSAGTCGVETDKTNHRPARKSANGLSELKKWHVPEGRETEVFGPREQRKSLGAGRGKSPGKGRREVWAYHQKKCLPCSTPAPRESQ